MFPALLARPIFGLDHATLADVAAILCEDEACLAPIANAANETTGEPRWIAGALIHALWRRLEFAPQVMSSVLKAWPEIVASLEAVMCFRANAAAEESDPFMFYQPVAAHSIPLLVSMSTLVRLRTAKCYLEASQHRSEISGKSNVRWTQVGQ